MNHPKTFRMTVLATAIAAACSWAAAQDVTLYESHVLPEALVFEPNSTIGMNSDIDIAVKGPNGLVLQQSFAAGEPMELNPATIIEGGLPDGTYRYEMKVMAIKGVVAQRNGKVGDVPEIAQPGFGTFTIRNGKLVSPDDEEPLYKGADAGASVHAAVQGTADTGKEETRQVIAQDLIVQGSLCVGFDCVNGESFGFDTLRLKENNTRIKFDDTSTSGSFPNNDWQLTANDSNNGGLNRFSIENTTVGRVPFTIEGPAPSNSLYVDDGGRVGFGTSTPVVQNHIVDGNTPTVRLEQDGSSGFTAQTFDIAANEANFFVRDVTNGSQLPFRIKPGADTDSLFIAANNNIGMGTDSPDTPLHLKNSARAGVKVEAGLDQQADLTFNDGGIDRFILRTRQTSHNFEIARRNDTGGFADTPLLISHSTGTTQLRNGLQFVEGNAPDTIANGAGLFFDSADGQLKVRLPDGSIKIVVLQNP